MFFSKPYLELKDDGTFVKHYSKFGHVGGQQIKIDIDPVTKAQTPTFIIPPPTDNLKRMALGRCGYAW